MTYAVKEIFLTLQGEGANVGRRAVFVRFSGCNLWSGREKDLAKAVCRFCDTDFVGGERMGLDALVERVGAAWDDHRAPFVVFTGGEPLLQLDAPLIDTLTKRHFRIAVETNGTQPAPAGVWLTVSPKAGAPFVQRDGDELKVVFPQPLDMAELSELPFVHKWVQPMDGPCLKENTAAAIAYCLANPAWKLSVQTHKMVGLR